MATQWLRRAWLVAACASALLLAACGGGKVTEPFAPTRVFAFGDAMGDLGQNGYRYTINDGSVNIWTEDVASQFGLTLTNSNAGGTSYAVGSARVTKTPGPAGTTSTLQSQIDTFLATGTALNDRDLILISAGTADVIAEAQAAIQASPTQTADQAAANAGQAGRDLTAQMQRLVNAGAKHIAVAGAYNLSRSPWATVTGQGAVIQATVRQFNDQFLTSAQNAGLGSSLLYVSMETFVNLVFVSPGPYGITNLTDPVCTSTGTHVGITSTSPELDSTACNSGTLVSGADPNQYVFADRVYLTPTVQRQFGNYAFPRIRDRW